MRHPVQVVRGALEHGFGVTLAGDAHTTVNDEVLGMMNRSFISAARIVAHHNHLLAGLRYVRPDREVLVQNTAEIAFAG